jgi:hypothetical protein
MSRAKNKMILFHSIPKDKLSNPNDLRKKILDWFYNRKTEERKAGLQAIREEVDRGRASEFEYEVAKIIINAGYKVGVDLADTDETMVEVIFEKSENKDELWTMTTLE